MPFPEGATLEQLALQYLGNETRWIELVALNGLKAPYIDEVGNFIPVIGSAGGNTLSVGSPDGFFIGQIVEISSDATLKTVRKIKSIDQVNSAQTILTFVDSDAGLLTAYKPKDNAKIHAYLPDTVNANMLIAIPSETRTQFTEMFKTSPELSELNSLAKIAKMDILINSEGDLVLSGGGDLTLAVGMTNMTQAAMLILKTGTETLLQIPDYGNPARLGESLANVDAKDTLDSISNAFKNDPRFSGLAAGEVKVNGGAVEINAIAQVSDSNLNLPLNLKVKI